MALSQSSPILPQNPANSIGRRQRDGCSKDTKRYRSAVRTARDSECSDINGALSALTTTPARAPLRFWLPIGDRNRNRSPLCSSLIAWLFLILRV
ncbi:hypothetical protein ACFX19_042806 [Malus domestica]